jgi:hypothetical protein
MYTEVGSVDWFDSLLHFKSNETALDTHIQIDYYLREHDYRYNSNSDRKITYTYDDVQHVFSVLSLNEQNKIEERFTIGIYRVINDSQDYGVYVSFYSEIRSGLPYPVSRGVFNDLKAQLSGSKTTLMEVGVV